MENLLQKLLALLAEGKEVEEVLCRLEMAPEVAAQTVDSPMPDFGDEIGGGLQPFIPNVVIPPEVYQLLAADRPAGVA